MRPRVLAALLACASIAASAWGQERWLYVLPADGSGVLAVDASGNVVPVELARAGAAGVYATPGGKFVFVRHDGVPELSVIDAETRKQHGAVPLAAVPDGVAFAPTGEKAYVSVAGSGRLLVFAHKRAVLTPGTAYDLGGGGGPLLLNRRGTRLYRSGAAGLGFYLESTGETIRSLPLPGGPGAWAFSPDFREVWGVPLAGGPLAVVDERAGSLERSLAGPYAGQAPLFSRDGARAYLLPAQRDRIVVVDARSLKVQGSLSVPEPLDSLAPGAADTLWALSGSRLRRLELPSGRVSLTVTLPRPGRALTVVELKPGEGFACF